MPLQGALYGARLPRVSFATLTLPWAMVSLALQAVFLRSKKTADKQNHFCIATNILSFSPHAHLAIFAIARERADLPSPFSVDFRSLTGIRTGFRGPIPVKTGLMTRTAGRPKGRLESFAPPGGLWRRRPKRRSVKFCPLFVTLHTRLRTILRARVPIIIYMSRPKMRYSDARGYKMQIFMYICTPKKHYGTP